MSKPTFSLILERLLQDGTTLRADFDPEKPGESEWVKEHILQGIPEANSKPSSLSFSVLSAAYLDELKARGKHTGYESCDHSFRLFTDIIGDIPISELTQGKLGEFKRQLQRLPYMYSKKAEFRGKAVKEILGLADRFIAPKTVANHIANIVSLTTWGRGNYDDIPQLTAKGVVEAKKADAHEERDAFTNADIVKLFSSEHFDDLDIESQWLLRLGALTGARIEELCQIDLSSDILQTHTGNWYLSINSEGDKSVKTSSAKRQIPLHPRLLELEVIEFFEKQRAKGATRPFEPRWKRYGRKWSKYASKWFGKYKTEVLGRTDRKVFHSFRHTVIDSLKKAHVDEKLTAALVGHREGSITYNRYGKPFGADDLLEVVKAIDLPIR